mmetsp:Transcript_98680/g.205712  ORF Transcript_98680/g.205712 Transcript_98680/m.205712 type:complete len:111 (+) Transcript_98680:18-350(+)
METLRWGSENCKCPTAADKLGPFDLRKVVKSSSKHRLYRGPLPYLRGRDVMCSLALKLGMTLPDLSLGAEGTGKSRELSSGGSSCLAAWGGGRESWREAVVEDAGPVELQ